MSSIVTLFTPWVWKALMAVSIMLSRISLRCDDFSGSLAVRVVWPLFEGRKWCEGCHVRAASSNCFAAKCVRLCPEWVICRSTYRMWKIETATSSYKGRKLFSDLSFCFQNYFIYQQISSLFPRNKKVLGIPNSFVPWFQAHYSSCVNLWLLLCASYNAVP